MEDRRVLLVKGTFGLGNRILTVLTAILYARLTGRQLIVDWRDRAYSQDGDNVFPRFFQCPVALPVDTLPATDSVRPAIWRGRLHDSAQDLRRTSGTRDVWRQLSIDLSRPDHDDDVLVMCTFVQEVEPFRHHLDAAFPELRGRATKAIMTEVLRESLVLHPSIRDRVERFRTAHFTSPVVGVHVRYSDHRGNLSGTVKRLEALLWRKPGLRIFLCTDSRQVAEHCRLAYPGVISTPHWYPAPGFTAHGTTSGGDRTDHGIEALVDLFLLGACDYLVLDTSSSFARVACLLSGIAPARVFDVARGPKHGPHVRSRLWRLWRVLRLFSWRFRLLRVSLRLGRALRGRPPTEAPPDDRRRERLG